MRITLDGTYSTASAYALHVRCLTERYQVLWTDPSSVRSGILSYLGEDIKPATYNLRLIYTRAFYRWCVEEGVIPLSNMDPFRGLKRKKAEGHFRNVDPDDVRKLLDLIKCESYTRERDKALILMTLDIAIRPGEALQLHPHDLDLVQALVSVPATVAKTRQSRTLPLSPQVVKQLHELEKYRPRSWGDEVPVFATQDGNVLTTREWYHRLKELQKDKEAWLRPYDLRHAS